MTTIAQPTWKISNTCKKIIDPKTTPFHLPERFSFNKRQSKSKSQDKQLFKSNSSLHISQSAWRKKELDATISKEPKTSNKQEVPQNEFQIINIDNASLTNVKKPSVQVDEIKLLKQ
jgi:hypothetical protein